jgi:hypothetical protein
MATWEEKRNNPLIQSGKTRAGSHKKHQACSNNRPARGLKPLAGLFMAVRAFTWSAHELVCLPNKSMLLSAFSNAAARRHPKLTLTKGDVMAYTVAAAPEVGGQTFTIVSLIQALRSKTPPTSIGFPNLGKPSNTTSLAENEGLEIPFSGDEQVVRSVNLLTCASVCYVSTKSGNGYVYHANAGVVSFAKFQDAIKGIGAKPSTYNTVYIAYAHQGASGKGYQDTIAELISWEIPSENIVEITNLFMNQWGMNNLLQLGY